MRWISQVRLDAGGGYSQIRRAMAEGAMAAYPTGDTAKRLMNDGKTAKLG
jgi:hypothetical protein